MGTAKIPHACWKNTVGGLKQKSKEVEEGDRPQQVTRKSLLSVPVPFLFREDAATHLYAAAC
jgi:hypothetical protein